MIINSDSVHWIMDTQSAFVAQHRAKHGSWTLLVTEYPKPPKSAPESQRHAAQVFSIRGTKVALRPTWCASLDAAKDLCIVNAQPQEPQS
jgi:hypothetical protein